MNIEQAVITTLESDATVTGLVGTRIFPKVAEQNAELPFIVIDLISQTPQHLMGSDTTVLPSRVQVTCYASTYASVKTLADAVRAELQDFSGQMGGGTGPTVQRAFLDNELDNYDSTRDRYEQVMDFFIWWVRA